MFLDIGNSEKPLGYSCITSVQAVLCSRRDAIATSLVAMSQPTALSRPLLAVGCATRVKLPLLLLGILVQMALDSLMGFHFSMKSLCTVFQCCVSTSFSSSFVQQLGQLPCFVTHFGMAVAEPALHLKKMENMSEDTASPWMCETFFKSFDFSLR